MLIKFLLFFLGIELQVPILDIVHSASHKDHVRKKIMTKGAIVQIDGTEFRNRLVSDYVHFAKLHACGFLT